MLKLVKKGKNLLLRIIDKGGFPNPDSLPRVQPPPTRVAFYAKDKIMALDAPWKGAYGEFLRNAAGEIAWLRMFSRVHPRE